MEPRQSSPDIPPSDGALTQTALVRAQRALRLHAALHEGVERARDEEALFDLACAIAVDVGGYAWAWVGRAEHDEPRTVRVVAHAGEGSHEVLGWEVISSERGSGPTGAAIRTRVPCVMRRLSHDPHASALREAAARLGLHAALALPIVVEGEVFGALTICAADPDAFGAEEVALLVSIVRGITQAVARVRARAAQRCTEIALLETERRLSLIFNATQELMLLLSPDGTIQEVNERALRRLGRTMEQTLGRRIAEVVGSGARAARLLTAVERVVRERGAVREEIELDVTQARGAAFDVVFAPLMDGERGEVRAVLIEALEITAQRQAERALAESQARLAAVLAEISDVVYSFSLAEQRLLYMSPAVEQVFGRPASFFEAGGRFLDVLHPDDRAEYASAMERIRAGDAVDGELRILRPDGEVRWLSNRARAVRGPRGAVDRIDGVLTDITARRTGDLALVQSERQLREIADHIPDVLWIMDPAMRAVIYVSRAWEAIWGSPLPSHESPASAWLAALEPDDLDGVRDALARCAAGEAVEIECRIRRPDGARRHLRARGFPVTDGAGRVTRVVGVTHDITAELAARAELPRTGVMRRVR